MFVKQVARASGEVVGPSSNAGDVKRMWEKHEESVTQGHPEQRQQGGRRKGTIFLMLLIAAAGCVPLSPWSAQLRAISEASRQASRVVP